MSFEDLLKNRRNSKKSVYREVKEDFRSKRRKELDMAPEDELEDISEEIKQVYSNDIIRVVLETFGENLLTQKETLDKDCAMCIIISGGEIREKAYFKYIIEYPKVFSRLRISVVTGTDELHRILRTANEKQGKLDTLLESEYGDLIEEDIIAIVTDVDVFRASILEVMPACKEKGYEFIISNPCFETWLYYHYFDKPPENFGPFEVHKISGELKDYLGPQEDKSKEIIPGGVKPDKDIFNYEQAITNSKANYKEDSDGIPELFCTQMHVLIERLKPYFEEGLKQIVQYEAEKAAKYKNQNK